MWELKKVVPPESGAGTQSPNQRQFRLFPSLIS